MAENKRGDLTGFDGIKGSYTAKRIKNWNQNQPAGRWRKINQRKIRYTYIKQKWTYDNKASMTIKHICPYGMVKFVTKLMTEERNRNQFHVLPNAVREELKLTKTTYNSTLMQVECSNDGDKGYDNFYLMSCQMCQKGTKYQELVAKHQTLLPNDKIESLLDRWDEIIAVDPKAGWFSDFCGCVIPNQVDVVAGPNNRRFILRPCDHANKYHKSTTGTSSSTSSSSTVQKRPLESPNNNTILIGNSKGQLQTDKQTTVTGVNQSGKKIKLTVKKTPLNLQHPKKVTEWLDPRVSIFETPKNKDQLWSQNFSLQVVQTGVNKTLSQAATCELYNTAVDGVRSWHQTIIGDLDFDGKKAPPPPRTTINEHNLPTIQLGMLEAYKQLESSPHIWIKRARPFSIFNDGIQKFSKELNGVMMRALDDEWNIVNIPWALSNIPGGSMDNVKLASQLVSVMGSIQSFRQLPSAEKEFLKSYEDEYPNEIAPTPPGIFKCTILEDIDFLNKEINLLFENWPVAFVGDGCGVNPLAGERMTRLYGFLTPTTRCSGHAASGSIKRLTSSKTMCVDEAVTFAKGVKPILKHFKNSGKSTATLNASLEIMEMKNIKLMMWCPTRMANIIDCSMHTVSILFPLCDMLATSGVKEEEVSYFLSPMCLGLLHLFSDLQGVFVHEFLRRLDADDALLVDVYRTSEEFVEAMHAFDTKQF